MHAWYKSFDYCITESSLQLDRYHSLPDTTFYERGFNICIIREYEFMTCITLTFNLWYLNMQTFIQISVLILSLNFFGNNCTISSSTIFFTYTVYTTSTASIRFSYIIVIVPDVCNFGTIWWSIFRFKTLMRNLERLFWKSIPRGLPRKTTLWR